HARDAEAQPRSFGSHHLRAGRHGDQGDDELDHEGSAHIGEFPSPRPPMGSNGPLVHPAIAANEPSSCSSFRLMARPPVYPPMRPPAATTRWQGITMGIGLCPSA